MARQLDRLSARKVETIKTPGYHADGGGLYLVVEPSGGKRWSFIYRWHGKRREMGLGGTASVPLARAREQAAEARRLKVAGSDPTENFRKQNVVAPGIPTFGEIADQTIADLDSGFRNAKHRAQWAMTLTTYCGPIRSKAIDQITTDEVLGVLKPMWGKVPETASRLRGRIEKVLDAAAARGLRSGDNPARWRNHLQNLLPARQKLTRGHHKAMPYPEVPAFMATLRENRTIAGQALEFTILTACRTSEVLGARWEEIDEAAAIWTLPAARMKAARDHRVPLSPQAMAVLDVVRPLNAIGYIFPGGKPGKPLSTMAMTAVLRRMNHGNVTVHGFRSSFRDWAAEETNFPREIAEAALAHVIGDATERAYRRGDALEKRRGLMEAWASYLDPFSAQPSGAAD